MSTSTYIRFLNANDPDFIKAKQTPEGIAEWESNYGSIEFRPGAEIEHGEEIVEEIDEEYGGWLIPVKAIPKDATHVLIFRM